jgi:hypothetical protein
MLIKRAQEEFWGFVDASGAPYDLREQAQRDERPYAKRVLALIEKLPNHTSSDLIFWKEELKTGKPPCDCDCERCTEQYRPLELSTE